MEWQQKAGRALKAWGRRSHWCCFRQKLFHVYACVTQPGDILCGDLSYNSSRAILFPKNAARVCSHLACVNVGVPLGRAAALRPARALRISSRCVGWICGVFFGGCWKTHTRTHTRTVSVRDIKTGPLRCNIQPINLSKGRLLSCVKRKGGAVNSWWCTAEVKSARRPPESPELSSLTKRQKQENRNDTTRDWAGQTHLVKC